MIVKDESHLITRCLSSLKPFIDSWVIVDTGSTDRTQEIIQEFLKDIPGELHERPWKNFAHNRNEALALAKNKADYILFIDADEELIQTSDFHKEDLHKDFYYITSHYGGARYPRIQLVNASLAWKWQGVLHETLECQEARSCEVLPCAFNFVRSEGARSKDPNTYLRDVKILEEACASDPMNTRYTFYLAQSYRDAGMYEKAIETYGKRVMLGGWHEEIFWSLYQIGCIQELLEQPPSTFLQSYEKAHQILPSRLEPVYRLTNYHRRAAQYDKAYSLSSFALSLPPAKSLLFVENWVEEYALLLEHAFLCLQLEKYEEGKKTYQRLLSNPNLPEAEKSHVLKNLSLL